MDTQALVAQAVRIKMARMVLVVAVVAAVAATPTRAVPGAAVLACLVRAPVVQGAVPALVVVLDPVG